MVNKNTYRRCTTKRKIYKTQDSKPEKEGQSNYKIDKKTIYKMAIVSPSISVIKYKWMKLYNQKT